MDLLLCEIVLESMFCFGKVSSQAGNFANESAIKVGIIVSTLTIHLPRDHNNICYWTNLFYPLFVTNNVKKDVNSFYIFSLTKILSQEISLCCIMQNCSMPQS